MSEIGDEVRERTRTFLRTERREAFARLREQLSEEEDELLVLRLGRRMSWLDIAGVVAPEAEEPRRVAAQLRKRYQRIKERLRELADSTSETDPDR